MLGHSPRHVNGKLSPVFYGGQHPVNRLIRSWGRSPHGSPRVAGQMQHSSSGSSGMGLLRHMGMLALTLMVMTLLYIQFATAFAPTTRSITPAAAAAAARALDPQQQPAEAAAAAAAAWGAASIQWQQQLASRAAAGQQAAAAAAAAFPAPELSHLVLVAGHAVYTGLDFAVATKEASWFLEPYQQVEGEAQSFLDHIKLGIETAAKDPAALLLFSGGQTRKAAGPRSEGLSYWLVAEAASWWGHPEVRGRAYTEEHARDSFENLLFSLCRFYEITGRYPTRITAVSYTLKQQRFEQLHRAAVRFPAASFSFVGTPVPPAAKGATEGEAATVAAFLRDPYGCSGSLLAKKSRRDPFAVGAPHPSRCPEMAGLLQHCGAKQYTGPVPWDAGKKGGKQGSTAAAAGAGALRVQGRHSSRSGIYT